METLMVRYGWVAATTVVMVSAVMMLVVYRCGGEDATLCFGQINFFEINRKLNNASIMEPSPEVVHIEVEVCADGEHEESDKSDVSGGLFPLCVCIPNKAAYIVEMLGESQLEGLDEVAYRVDILEIPERGAEVPQKQDDDQCEPHLVGVA